MEIRWLGRGPLSLSHTHRTVEQGALEGGRAMAIRERKKLVRMCSKEGLMRARKLSVS